jgi:group I intron endonuclease
MYVDPRLAGRSGIYCILGPDRADTWAAFSVEFADERTTALYVGGSDDLYRRGHDGHLADLRLGKHANRHLQAAWNLHGPEAFSFHVLQFCAADEIFFATGREQFWLDLFYGSRDVKVYNLTHESGLLPSNRGRKHTAETKAKVSAGQSGKKNYNFGKHLSDEQKAKISTAKTGKKASPEACAKNRAANTGENNSFFGKKHSPETRAKMSAAQSGKKRKPLSAEHRAKLSAAKLGVPKSAEHRAAMSAAQIGKKHPADCTHCVAVTGKRHARA